MVILTKIKSATLVEVIVATVLIIIVFMIASLILNNLVLNTFSNNTQPVENRLNELEYQFENGLIKLPYDENYKDWKIIIKNEKELDNDLLIIEATRNPKKKQILRKLILNAEK